MSQASDSLLASISQLLPTGHSKWFVNAASTCSHGGVSEQKVPLILNRPVKAAAEGRALRNFDAFDLVMNSAA